MRSPSLTRALIAGPFALSGRIKVHAWVNPLVAAAALLVALTVGFRVQKDFLPPSALPAVPLLWPAAALLGLTVWLAAPPLRRGRSPRPRPLPLPVRWRRRASYPLLLAALASLLIGLVTIYRDLSSPDGAHLWLIGMVGVAAALAIRELPAPRFPRRASTWIWALAGIALVGGALALRLYRLEQVPALFNFDELSDGGFALSVYRHLPPPGGVSPENTSPFITGNFGATVGGYYVYAAIAHVVGPSVAGIRTGSALFGALGVGLLYLFLRDYVRPWAALAAAALMAVNHSHLYWSRTTANMVVTASALTAIAWLLLRGMRSGGYLPFVLAGLVTGALPHVYWSWPAAVLIEAAFLGYLALRERPLLRARCRQLSAMAAAGLVAFLPLGFWYQRHPELALSRTGQVFFYLDPHYRDFIYPGMSIPQIVVAQLRSNLIGLAVGGDPARMHYAVGEPLLDPVTGALMLATLLGISMSWRRREIAFTAIWLWLPTLTVVLLTDRPLPMTRLIMVLPALYAAIGFALDRMGQLLQRIGGRGTLAYFALPLLLAVAYAGSWNATNFFVRFPERSPGDRQSALLRAVDATPPETAIYVVDDNEFFEGRDVRMVAADRVGASLTPDELPLALLGHRDAAFFFAPGRQDVLGRLRRAYPDGELREEKSPRGDALWSVYSVPAAQLDAARPPGARWWQYDARFGEIGTRFGDLGEPRAVAIDAAGRSYVADRARRRVVVFGPSGEPEAEIGRPSSARGGLVAPSAVAVDPNGDLLIADEGSGWIERYSPGDRWLGRLGGPTVLNAPGSLAVYPDGSLLVLNGQGGSLVRLARDGRVLARGSAGQPGGVNRFTGLALDPSGDAFAVDSALGQVRRFDGDLVDRGGFAVASAGSSPVPLAIAQGDGALWVTNPAARTVDRYRPTGERDWSVGAKPGDPNALRNTFHRDPLSYRAIASDRAGSLYVLDGTRGHVYRYDVAKRRW